MTDKKMKLFGCCYTVKGVSRSIICDLQYGKMDYIPNDLFDFLDSNQGKTLAEIYAFYNQEENETINEYIEFLVENEYVFFAKNPDQFPPLHKKWYTAAKITNAIIDIDSTAIQLTPAIISQLENLGVVAVQLRFKDFISIEKLDSVLSLFLSSSLRCIELILKYDDDSHNNLPELATKHLRISYISIHSSPSASTIEHTHITCFYMQGNIAESTGNGPRSISHLAINKQIFMESQFHNTYLNKKIYISEKGDVRNSPETPALGNCFNLSLEQIADHLIADKNNFWNVRKDETKICRDCEFRYFCIDSRIPSLNKITGEYFNERECDYNPFQARWKNETEKQII